MIRKVLAVCWLAILCFGTEGTPQELKLKRGTVCWPLHFSGITLGITDDPQVQRLLGKGIARRNEGDTGGRYFVDEQHTATLHVLSYTDFVIGEVTLQSGIDSHLKENQLKQAESKWFKPDEGFGNWHALRLGSTRDEVLKNLGEPRKKVNANDWIYETICECELPEYFAIFFKDDRIIKVVFSAPAG